MKSCKELLNDFFIEKKGYDPESRFIPSNESLSIYENLKEDNEKLKESLALRVAEVELHFQFIWENDLQETFNSWICSARKAQTKQ